jgi:K(+)-stimulated pyrophosphate-energized sodium pump
MSHLLAADAGIPASATRVTGGNYGIVIGVAVVAICALAVAYGLVREVLAASEGSAKMRDIARAVQEGAAAYLARQFRTLAVFAVLLFAILFILPADTAGERVGRSIFFLVGAVFSATTGSRSGPAASRACSPSASACSARRSSC